MNQVRSLRFVPGYCKLIALIVWPNLNTFTSRFLYTDNQRRTSRLEKGSCEFKVVGLNPQSPP